MQESSAQPQMQNGQSPSQPGQSPGLNRQSTLTGVNAYNVQSQVIASSNTTTTVRDAAGQQHTYTKAAIAQDEEESYFVRDSQRMLGLLSWHANDLRERSHKAQEAAKVAQFGNTPQAARTLIDLWGIQLIKAVNEFYGDEIKKQIATDSQSQSLTERWGSEMAAQQSKMQKKVDAFFSTVNDSIVARIRLMKDLEEGRRQLSLTATNTQNVINSTDESSGITTLIQPEVTGVQKAKQQENLRMIESYNKTIEGVKKVTTSQLGILNELVCNLDPKIKEAITALKKEDVEANKLKVAKQSAPVPEILFPVNCSLRYSDGVRLDYKYGDDFQFPPQAQLDDLQKNQPRVLASLALMTVMNNAEKHYWSFKLSNETFSDEGYKFQMCKRAELHPADTLIKKVEIFSDSMGLCGLAFYDDLMELVSKVGLTQNRSSMTVVVLGETERICGVKGKLEGKPGHPKKFSSFQLILCEWERVDIMTPASTMGDQIFADQQQ